MARREPAPVNPGDDPLSARYWASVAQSEAAEARRHSRRASVRAVFAIVAALAAIGVTVGRYLAG